MPRGPRAVGCPPEVLESPFGARPEPLPHFLRREFVTVPPERRGLVELDLLLLLPAVRAPLPLRRLPGGLLRDVLDVLLPAELLHLLHFCAELLRLLLRQEEAAAPPARRLDQLLELLHVPHVDHGHRKVDVAEVAGAVVDLPAARLAPEAGLDHPEVGVHQAHVDREAVVVVRVRRDDLRRGHPPELVRAQEGEPDRLDPLRDPACGHHLRSSSWSRIATPRESISSRRSLNAYDVWTG